METELDLQAKYLEEMIKVLTEISNDYGEELTQALHARNVWIGRLTFLGRKIDNWYAEKVAFVLNEDPKMAQWKLDAVIDITVEGKLHRLKKSVIDTIKMQCGNIANELLDNHVDRKYSTGPI